MLYLACRAGVESAHSWIFDRHDEYSNHREEEEEEEEDV